MTASTPLRRYSGWLFVLPYLILFSVFLVLPLIYGLVLSLYKSEMLSVVKPAFVGAANYTEALHDAYFWKAMWATVRFVALSVPITICLSLLVALGVSRARGGLATLLRAAYFVPTVLTISVAGLVWRWFYNSEFGLFNAVLPPAMKAPWLTNNNWAAFSIVIMTVWWTLGGPMVVLLAGISGIPASYHEAAALDGAAGWQVIRHITLPLLRPALLFVTVMNVIGAFQVFGQTFMITRGGPEMSTRSMVQYIYETAFNNYRMGYAAALSWMLFAVIGLFALLQFRLMREK